MSVNSAPEFMLCLFIAVMGFLAISCIVTVMTKRG